jgi:hypothetical protein
VWLRSRLEARAELGDFMRALLYGEELMVVGFTMETPSSFIDVDFTVVMSQKTKW